MKPLKPVQNKYYISFIYPMPRYEEAESAKAVNIDGVADCFSHPIDGCFRVSDGVSGASFGTGLSRRQAIADARATIKKQGAKKFIVARNKIVKRIGYMSPRYTEKGK